MFRVGVDIGGTFTDLFAWEEGTSGARTARTAKVLTTPEDPSVGVIDALHKAGIAPSEISRLIHGTTIATNALLERKYAEPAVVCTEGFRDTLEIGRQRRETLYDPYQVKTKPLVSRYNRFTVPEKLAWDGAVVQPLDEDAARKVAREIARRGITSVAICFINGYKDTRHEMVMRKILLEEIPGVQVAVSGETRPKVRELGRFTTTAIRAAMLPVVGDYMSRLEAQLQSEGCTAPLSVVKSNGGKMGSETAKERPEELIASGPAGGVAAGGYLSELTGLDSLIMTDVGGTSFEASLLENGRGLVADEYELEWEKPVIVPMLDIRSIGAGGGSIAWVDDGGSLRVGPHSAGASPGPACYGRGGERPTVTDANLVLGRISADLGGKFSLDVEAARTAIGTVAESLGLSVEKCAESVAHIVSANMANAIRMVSSDRGRDPRDQTLVAFGGAGGLHACEIAKSAGVPKVLVPPYAGVACAFGATTMDDRHDLETTFYSPTADVDVDALNAAYEVLEEQARDLMKRDGIPEDTVMLERSAAMRYIGQSYEVNTPVGTGTLTKDAISDVVEAFWREHHKEYGVHSEDFPTAFVNVRVTAIGTADKPTANEVAVALGKDSASSQRSATNRKAYFNGEYVDVDVLDAAGLVEGQTVTGPTVIEQPDGVVVVPAEASAVADRFGNVIINLEESAA